MAEPMNGLKILLAVVCACWMMAAVAETNDPTRPPANISAPVAAESEVESQPTGLQSIFISPTRRAAIIAGQTVELGGKYGDAKLIEVHEGSVVLRGPQGRQVLSLFPGVKITRKNAATKSTPLRAVKSASSGRHKAKPVAHKEGK
ncbi:MAG: hypothetical protein PHY62_09505 [Gallionella sp.]|nr:hypothetical protein [Gallionella sp.]